VPIIGARLIPAWPAAPDPFPRMPLIIILVKGIFSGLAMAIPMGPVGVLCLRRTLDQGRLAGMLPGLGAAAADGLYSLIAVLGISSIADWFIKAEPWLRPAGGLFLLVLGGHALLCQRPRENQEYQKQGWLGGLSIGFALTISNPLMLVGLSAVFVAIGLADDLAAHPLSSGLAVAGVFAGSALWFFLLSLFAGWFGKSLSQLRIKQLNWATSAVLSLMGAVILWNSLG
jgi:threonine/homoserine/homoserine lactone efflux protein